jgi:demethylspheroidene O-methyltransferase
MTSAALNLRERWFTQRDRLLTSPRFREAASRFAATRPIARQRARDLFDLVAGFVYSQWLLACVELKLFERLAAAPMTAEQLARESNLPLLSAQRLLEAAASLGLTQVRASGGEDDAPQTRYGLGPLGAAMVGNEAVTAMVEHHRALYTDLADPLALLREGRGSGALAQYWAYAGAGDAGPRPERAPGALPDAKTAPYSALMSASQPLVAGQVLDAYPIGRHHRVLLDLGGGEGVFAAAALARSPRLKAMVFDLPAVADAARARFARAGLADRAQAVGGDFHRDALPEGADIVSLVRVIYDHDDAPALAILRAARRALPAGGTLLLAEPMAGAAGAEPMGAAYFGMYLMAMGSGRSRSAGALTALLHQAGFAQVRRRPTALPLQAGVLVARAV